MTPSLPFAKYSELPKLGYQSLLINQYNQEDFVA